MRKKGKIEKEGKKKKKIFSKVHQRGSTIKTL